MIGSGLGVDKSGGLRGIRARARKRAQMDLPVLPLSDPRFPQSSIVFGTHTHTHTGEAHDDHDDCDDLKEDEDGREEREESEEKEDQTQPMRESVGVSHNSRQVVALSVASIDSDMDTDLSPETGALKVDLDIGSDADTQTQTGMPTHGQMIAGLIEKYILTGLHLTLQTSLHSLHSSLHSSSLTLSPSLSLYPRSEHKRKDPRSK